MKIKLKLVIACATAAALIGGLAISDAIHQNLGIRDQVQSCFKRYTKRLSFEPFSIKLTKTEGDQSRESVTSEQIACAAKRLGFRDSVAKEVNQTKQGRVDNDKFAVIWKVVQVSDCVAWESQKESENVSAFSSTKCLKTKVVRTERFVSFKDYR